MQDRHILVSAIKKIYIFIGNSKKKSDQGGVKNLMILFKDDSI